MDRRNRKYKLGLVGDSTAEHYPLEDLEDQDIDRGIYLTVQIPLRYNYDTVQKKSTDNGTQINWIENILLYYACTVL